ncbi:hypothetical protein Tco_0467988 [Tanacetum coccineum]
MKYQPLNFKGTEGVVELTQWFEKMETVFRISNCSMENQIKFSTCTLLGSALTWWNSQDAIEIETELMDKKIRTLAERQAKNKMKFDNNDQAQQASFPTAQCAQLTSLDGKKGSITLERRSTLWQTGEAKPQETDLNKKDKNEAKTDKTEHGMERA